MSATVNGLKNSVKATYSKNLDNLSPDLLELYKITVNDDDELRESVDNLESGQLLHGNQLVKEVFDDVLFSQMPRVVIELLGESKQSHDELSVAAVPSVVHGRLTYIRAWDNAPKKSPSEQGIASNFKILQSTDRKIEWTRPPDGIPTIPVTLLHTVFGEFVDECRTHEPTSEDNTFVLELSSQMSKFFENESQRQKTFMEILRNHNIGIVASSIADSDYQTDGDVHVNGCRYMILEVKSEVGSKGAEPYCQAILYYFEGSKDEVTKASKKQTQFNFPCLIITLFGPHLSFSGAVWTDRPNYQILSTVLPLFWHPTDTVMRQSAARRIGAFTKACQRLKELYVNYNRTPENFKDLQPEFPHPRCYKILDKQDWVHFRYIHSLEASKLLFIVETDAGQKLCVKFARSYNRVVHEQCAAWGISPSLKGLEAVPGGWHMVVMDLLEGYECLYDIRHNLSREQRERLRDELRRSLQKLHQIGLVHGDVRDANVMVTKDRLGWMLVDFDWSGKIEEVRYPMNVNRGLGLRRPEGALDGELILANHDMEMLDYMFQ
ncbi:hypothetical protein EDC04DRAFT_2589995 [Pisolithus marmoratus]|nr:hypothetical protein EDC04DRAFT_2589995 [Pisolithus marmoratus]